MTTFDEARRIAEKATSAVCRAGFDEAEALAAEDIEVITRDGPRQGADAIAYLREFWSPQRETFDIEHRIERTLDAGDGTVVVLSSVTRLGKDPKMGHLKAWPASVIRVRDGRVSFFEGYVDRGKALRSVGLPEDA